MISFSKIMREVLLERASFKDLLKISEPGRLQRAKNVRSKSLNVTTIDDTEAWTFTYKSSGGHSTTGKRWHGHIRFIKDEVSHKDNAEDLDCKVSCSCPDYTFRYAYNNHRADAGDLGQNNGKPPRPRSQGGVGDYGSGMCKHLCALGKFLRTNIEAPEPDDEAPEPEVNKSTQPAPRVTPETPATTDAPTPDDSYTDSRSDGYSDSRSGLNENNGESNLFIKMNQFVKQHPQFNVEYE